MGMSAGAPSCATSCSECFASLPLLCMRFAVAVVHFWVGGQAVVCLRVDVAARPWLLGAWSRGCAASCPSLQMICATSPVSAVTSDEAVARFL